LGILYVVTDANTVIDMQAGKRVPYDAKDTKSNGNPDASERPSAA